MRQPRRNKPSPQQSMTEPRFAWKAVAYVRAAAFRASGSRNSSSGRPAGPPVLVSGQTCPRPVEEDENVGRPNEGDQMDVNAPKIRVGRNVLP
jgi:hypothetical protein